MPVVFYPDQIYGLVIIILCGLKILSIIFWLFLSQVQTKNALFMFTKWKSLFGMDHICREWYVFSVYVKVLRSVIPPFTQTRQADSFYSNPTSWLTCMLQCMVVWILCSTIELISMHVPVLSKKKKITFALGCSFEIWNHEYMMVSCP